MEYSPIKLNYKIIENEKIVGTGEIYSTFCHSLTEMYIDYAPDKYSIEFEHNGKTFRISSPY